LLPIISKLRYFLTVIAQDWVALVTLVVLQAILLVILSIQWGYIFVMVGNLLEPTKLALWDDFRTFIPFPTIH